MNYDSQPENGGLLKRDWAMQGALLILCLLIGWFLGSMLNIFWTKATGVDLQALVRDFSKESPLDARNQMRLLNLIAHFCTFTLSSVLIAVFLFRRAWRQELSLRSLPPVSWLSVGLLALAAFPLAQAVYWLNQRLPLPESLLRQESQTNEMIAGIMVMNNGWELVFNLLLAALAPAVGEELLFRGIIQNQLEKRTGRTALAVWITAACFSAIHFQFAGFLPRLLLGGLLGYTLIWTRSLWAPITAHFVFNGIQVAGAWFLGQTSAAPDPDKIPAPFVPLLIISLLFTFALAWVLRRRRGTGCRAEGAEESRN